MGMFKELANKNRYGWKDVPNLKMEIYTIHNKKEPARVFYFDVASEVDYSNADIYGKSYVSFTLLVMNLDEYFFLKESIEMKTFSHATLEMEQIFRSEQTLKDEELTYPTGMWTSIEIYNKFSCTGDNYGTTITLRR